MSEMQHYTGKAKLLLRHYRETLEDQIRDVIGSNPEKLKEGGWQTYREQLNDEYYEEYVIVNDQLFKLEDLKEHDGDDDIYNAHAVGIDYQFEVQFYNGGESLEGAVEEAIRRAIR